MIACCCLDATEPHSALLAMHTLRLGVVVTSCFCFVGGRLCVVTGGLGINGVIALATCMQKSASFASGVLVKVASGDPTLPPLAALCTTDRVRSGDSEPSPCESETQNVSCPGPNICVRTSEDACMYERNSQVG